MIIERSLHPDFLSNTYVLAHGPGEEAVVIDAGGPSEPLFEAVDRHDLRPTHLLLTHHHYDHVVDAPAWRERFGLEVMAHPIEAGLMEGVDTLLEPGQQLEVAGLGVKCLHTPGHTGGMLSFLVGGAGVFTGDTLFKGSVGGVRAPGATTFEDLKRSIMEVLLELPPETVILPGHTDATTVADEWEQNAFVRVWRGLDAESDERCRVGEDEATLVLFAPDYDGGHKAWVRWDDGRDDIVPGSMVVRDAAGA